jgi:hypothetical protein
VCGFVWCPKNVVWCGFYLIPLHWTWCGSFLYIVCRCDVTGLGKEVWKNRRYEYNVLFVVTPQTPNPVVIL